MDPRAINVGCCGDLPGFFWRTGVLARRSTETVKCTDSDEG
jgi:hypothetical protein